MAGPARRGVAHNSNSILLRHCIDARECPLSVRSSGSDSASDRGYHQPAWTFTVPSQSFDSFWFDKYKWLHYDEAHDAAYCYTCQMVDEQTKDKELAFKRAWGLKAKWSYLILTLSAFIHHGLLSLPPRHNFPKVNFINPKVFCLPRHRTLCSQTLGIWIKTHSDLSTFYHIRYAMAQQTKKCGGNEEHTIATCLNIWTIILYCICWAHVHVLIKYAIIS